MGFGDFSLGDAYTAIITKLNTQLAAVGKLFKNQTTGDFVDQVRYNSTAKRLEYWTGSAWALLDMSGTAAGTAASATAANNATRAGNFTPSQTPGANNIVVIGTDGKLALHGSVPNVMNPVLSNTLYSDAHFMAQAAAGYTPAYGFYESGVAAVALYKPSGDVHLALRSNAGDAFTVWDSGNDGPGSGLDADTLDGLQAASFALVSAFGGTLAATGAYTSQGGIITKWGTTNLCGGGANPQTFAQPFPTACFHVWLTPTSSASVQAGVDTISASGFNVAYSGAAENRSYRYFAVGN